MPAGSCSRRARGPPGAVVADRGARREPRHRSRGEEKAGGRRRAAGGGLSAAVLPPRTAPRGAHPLRTAGPWPVRFVPARSGGWRGRFGRLLLHGEATRVRAPPHTRHGHARCRREQCLRPCPLFVSFHFGFCPFHIEWARNSDWPEGGQEKNKKRGINQLNLLLLRADGQEAPAGRCWEGQRVQSVRLTVSGYRQTSCRAKRDSGGRSRERDAFPAQGNRRDASPHLPSSARRHLSAEVDPAHPRPFSCERMQTGKPTLPSATASDFPGLRHVGAGKGEVLSSQERVNKFDS